MDIPQIFDSPLSSFILFFIFTYILGYFIIFKNWSINFRAEASSCLMSLAHGTPVLVMSIISIFHSQNDLSLFEFATARFDLSLQNTEFQYRVLEFSTAYFLMDLLHYFVWNPRNYLFIAHHVVTLYVLMTCRYLFDHGAAAILGILILAEITTSCQNSWSLARLRKFDSEKAASVFEFISPIFYGYYSLVRGIVAPLFVMKIIYFFATSDVVPIWAWISWIVVTLGGIGFSLLWVSHLWMDLYRRKFGVKKLN